MFVQSYKIVEPKRFEVYVEDVICDCDHVLVKIEYAAICKADLRYYAGERDKNTLGLKYPIALIHEATGVVLKTANGFNIGEHVVLVPNNSAKKCENCVCDIKELGEKSLGENYCPNAIFSSSNADGFSKQIVAHPSKSLVKIPNADPTYVLCELISVAIAATRRVKIEKSSKVFVWGDGILGYILCAVIKKMHGCEVGVVGKHEDKLAKFVMCDKKYTSDLTKLDKAFDIAFECIGGKAVASALSQIISEIRIGGTIVLTGVSEDDTPVNTRKILEKGITLTGSTRSHRQDFASAVLLLQDEDFYNQIKILVQNIVEIKNINEYYLAFETEFASRALGKNILRWS